MARGYDFEYATSPDKFSARRCRACGNVYLDAGPDVSQFERIYPPEYHSLDFSEELLPGPPGAVPAGGEPTAALLRGRSADARILDAGCGDAW
jgi:hypothetical protein